MINMSVNNVTGDIKQDKRLRVNFNIPEERKEVIQDNKCDECQRKLESKNSFSIHKSRIHRSNLSKKKEFGKTVPNLQTWSLWVQPNNIYIDSPPSKKTKNEETNGLESGD